MGSSKASRRGRGLSGYMHIWHRDHWFWPYLRQDKGLLQVVFGLDVQVGCGLVKEQNLA